MKITDNKGFRSSAGNTSVFRSDSLMTILVGFKPTAHLSICKSCGLTTTEPLNLPTSSYFFCYSYSLLNVDVFSQSLNLSFFTTAFRRRLRCRGQEVKRTFGVRMAHDMEHTSISCGKEKIEKGKNRWTMLKKGLLSRTYAARSMRVVSHGQEV